MRKVLYIFGQLTDMDVEWLASAGARQNVAAGHVLITEGEPVESIYILLDGKLAVTTKTSQGHDIAHLLSGDIVGEMSFVDASPPAATVKADEASQVLAIPRQSLIQKLEQDDGFAARFYRAIAIFLSDRLRNLMFAQTNASSGEPAGDLEEDELDPNVLENVSLAGSRFERMLKKLKGE